MIEFFDGASLFEVSIAFGNGGTLIIVVLTFAEADLNFKTATIEVSRERDKRHTLLLDLGEKLITFSCSFFISV